VSQSGKYTIFSESRLPYTLAYSEIAVTESSQLPIHLVLDEIKIALRQHHNAILEAPPGAGKTTAVPIALLDEPWLSDKKIILLQPRRVAARAAAERMAQLLGEPVGARVGYQIRQDTKISQATQITVVTEGVLIRKLQDDPSLDDIGLIIFDEFHERHLDSDLSLALALHGRDVFREEQPLKLLIMSATLNSDSLGALLNQPPVIRSEGKMFPVTTQYWPTTTRAEDLVPNTISSLRRILQEDDGSVLVFLPGQREIHKVAASAREFLPEDVLLAPLYGNLSVEQQYQAIAPITDNQPGTYRRKVVLATDIAETSLTIDGISVVLDSGFVRASSFDPNTGVSRLETTRISQASAVQRRGRAGRLGPGKCYRLWSESQHHTLADHHPPEIRTADLLPLALQIACWGVHNPDELTWLDTPPEGRYMQAVEKLHAQGALAKQSCGTILTEHGNTMASLPCHPQIAHMIVSARAHGLVKDACLVAAILDERDPFSHVGTDFADRVAIAKKHQPCPKPQQPWLRRTLQQQDKYVRASRRVASTTSNAQPLIDDNHFGMLLAIAFPDRIGRRADATHSPTARYKLANGRIATLSADDPMCRHEWIVAVDLGGFKHHREDKIFRAIELDIDLVHTSLPHLVKDKDDIRWDKQSARFIVQQQRFIGAILWQSTPLTTLSKARKAQALIDYIRDNGLDTLPWTPADKQWLARLTLVKSHDTSETWPDLSSQALLDTLEHWLGPYLDDVSREEDLKRLSLGQILKDQLPWASTQKLDQLAPERISVPSGSSIALDYLHSSPILAVKLQEMFGCAQSPTILNGKVTITTHLLSPARRPLQITQDLKGFWLNAYDDVKKEMKGRYPKHPWPDDPLDSQATRYTKKRSR